MMITTLIEDTNCTEAPDLQASHGLALYIETGDKTILFDMGPDNVHYIDNAAKLGKPLEAVDFAVVSHGHYDHGGGYAGFCALNKSAPVYMLSQAVSEGHYGKRKDGSFKDAGFSLGEYADRAVFLDVDHPDWAESQEFSPCRDIILFAGFPENGYIPQGNNRLFSGDVKSGYSLDSFDHEVAMLLLNRDTSSYTLITGCSHRGIGNIIARAVELAGLTPIAHVLGGFHLIDTERDNSPESSAMLNTLVDELGQYPEMQLYTGHCTGKQAYAHLEKTLGDRVHALATGVCFTL